MNLIRRNYFCSNAGRKLFQNVEFNFKASYYFYNFINSSTIYLWNNAKIFRT